MEKGKVIASCGHELKDDEGPNGFGWDALTMSDDYDDQGYYRCTIYSIVCTKCYNEMKKDGELLTDKEGDDWIRDGKIPERLQNK